MKKIKSRLSRLWLIVRCWLIKKLGGFVEQKSITNVTRYTSIQFTPVKLMAKTEINMEMIYELGESKAFTYAIRDLADRVAELLITQNHLILECYDDRRLHRRVYAARLYLVPPKAAAMYDEPMTAKNESEGRYAY